MKERIIGAAVLVVFAVLVVPIFLDGPSDDQEVVSQSVTLPGQSEQDRIQQTIVLDRDREQPVPATRTPEPAKQQAIAASPAPDEELVAETQQEAPATTPPPTPEPASATNSSSTGMWAVQLGSFSSQENAERLAADLRNQGYAAFLSQVQTDGGQLHRVRIGPQKDRESAEEIAAQLERSGQSGQVVPHP